MSARRRSLLLSLVTILTAAGCAAEPADMHASQEAEQRIRPNGPEKTPGSLTVVPPPVSPGTVLLPVQVMLGTEETALGQTFAGVPEADAPLFLRAPYTRYPYGVGRYTVKARIRPLASRANEVRLGGVALALRGPGARTAGHGGPVRYSYRDEEVPAATGADARFTRLGTVIEIDAAVATQEITLPVPPGRHHLEFGLYDGQVIDVAAAETVVRDLRDYAQRRVARLVPAARALPNACGGPATISRTTPNGREQLPVELDAPLEVGENPRLLPYMVGPLKVDLPCVNGRSDLPLGEVGAGPLDVTLGRADVDDVEVARPDGAVQSVRGTYRIYRGDTPRPGDNEVLAYELPTNTGVDLWPGTYTVVVTFPQAAGTRGTFQQTFTTP